jgi:hypothetical protein
MAEPEPTMARRRRAMPDEPRPEPAAAAPQSWAAALYDMDHVDVASEYRSLTADLQLGVQADNYGEVLRAVDAATKQMHRAGVVYRRVKLDVEADVAQVDQELQEMVAFGRDQFKDQLAKNASDERVLALVGLTRSSDINRLMRRRREAEASSYVFEKLEEAWKQRCRHLDTMLGRVAR